MRTKRVRNSIAQAESDSRQACPEHSVMLLIDPDLHLYFTIYSFVNGHRKAIGSEWSRLPCLHNGFSTVLRRLKILFLQTSGTFFQANEKDLSGRKHICIIRTNLCLERSSKQEVARITRSTRHCPSPTQPHKLCERKGESESVCSV